MVIENDLTPIWQKALLFSLSRLVSCCKMSNNSWPCCRLYEAYFVVTKVKHSHEEYYKLSKGPTLYGSFHVIHPNLLEVRAWTDSSLSSLVIFYVNYMRMMQIVNGARTATRALDLEWLYYYNRGTGSKVHGNGPTNKIFRFDHSLSLHWWAF